MSEILSKAQQSSAVLADTSIAPWQRVCQSLMALSGLSLSDLSTTAARFVEVKLAAMNQILSDYEIETFDDYEVIDDADIGEMLERIQAATEAVFDSEVERVMSGLRGAKNKIPRNEIEEVRQHTDIFVPRLIDAVERAIAAARAGNEPEGQTHFFAAFLLTELAVDEAVPVLLDGFRLHGEGAFDLFGDAIHELLPRALALFSRDGTGMIDQLLQDTGVNMYVRWAASGAYKLLVRDGTITRDIAVAKLDVQLKRCIAEEDHDLCAPIICELANLAAAESLGTIQAAYDQGLADESIVRLKHVETQISEGDQTIQETLERCRPSGMPDTIAELSHWASFREQPKKPTRPPKIHQPQAVVPAPKLVRPQTNQLEPVGTVQLDRSRVRRNDPCPCGSGKKFKKCCR